VSNTNVVAIELGATSSVNFLGSNILLLINGDINSSDVHNNVKLSSAKFPRNLYIWLEYPHPRDVDFYVLVLMTKGIEILPSANQLGGMGSYLSTHSNLLVVVDNKMSSHFVNMYSDIYAKLPSELQGASWSTIENLSYKSHDLESYLTYSSQRISLYAVELPI
jgi:hypothetical protein